MALFFTQDAQFDFELTRTLGHAAYGGAELGEVLSTARRITEGDYDSWYDEWEATGQRLWDLGEQAAKSGHPVSARDAFHRASNYFRTAEFFLHANPSDERILRTSRRSVDSFCRAAELMSPAIEPISIAYRDTTLPGYFIRAETDGPAPTVLLHNGFDGTAEELYVMGGRAGQERGYHVIAFDGPGQGQVIREQGLPFTPDWHEVIAAVIDFASARPEVDAERIALIGISMGGVLAPMAAAKERRLAAVVAFDGVYDMQQVPLEFVLGLQPDRWEEFRARLSAPSDGELDSIIEEQASVPGPVRWQVTHGSWVLGAPSYRLAYGELGKYTVRNGLAQEVECPALILSAANDMTLAGQAEQLYEALQCQKHLHRFEEHEGGDLHNQIDTMRRACAVIYDWLDDTIGQTRPSTEASR